MRPGVALALPTRLPAPAQKRSSVPLDSLGLQVPHPECAPGDGLFEPSSPPLSTSGGCLLLLFGINCIRNESFPGASASRPRLPALARRPELRGQVPPGPKEPPSTFGDLHASSYPQPSLRQGHSWAGSGQSARLGTSVLARVALKARDGGGGSKPAPQSQADTCPLDRRRRQQGTSDGNSFSFPLGKRERLGVGQVGSSLLLSSPRLPSPMPQGASLLEGNRVPRPRGSGLGAPGGAGARDPLRLRPAGRGPDPACSELAFGWATKPRPGALGRGRVKNNSIKTLQTFGFI